MTRPTSSKLCLACGEVPCSCEARKAVAKERARMARMARSLVEHAAAVLLHCRCDACGHTWTAGTLGDCPGCGGTARLLEAPPRCLTYAASGLTCKQYGVATPCDTCSPPCPHTDLEGHPLDLTRRCRRCGSLRIAGAGGGR